MSKKFAEHSQLNLSQVNKDVLKKWDENDVFAKSMTEREGCPSFVFYEGPPSANDMPGIHHVMARTIKDTFCRYKTRKGFQVKRKAGCDTHGLPVEPVSYTHLRYINEIFPIRVRVDTPRTIPDLEERGVGPPMDKCISYLC